VIVRLSGVGQFRLGDEALGALNELDNRAVAAVDGGDDEAFQRLLAEMIALVRDSGDPVPDDELAASDVVVPPGDTTLAEASAEFSGEGLLPG
jgi:hypothetical protein